MKKRMVLFALLLACLAMAGAATAAFAEEKMMSQFRVYIDGPTQWKNLFHPFKDMNEEDTVAAYDFLQEVLAEHGYWDAFKADAGGFLHLADENWPLYALLKQDAIPTHPMPLAALKEQFLASPAHEKTAEEAFDLFTEAQSDEGTQFSRLTASSLTVASSRPAKLTLRNDPVKRIQASSSQTEYYAAAPTLRGTPELESFIKKYASGANEALLKHLKSR